MTEAGAPAAPAASTADGWRRLSPWSLAHFAARGIIKNIQAAIFAGGFATYGVAQSNLARYAWTIPIGILALVLIGAVLDYIFYSYRLHGDFVEVRQGALLRKHLNLPFARIQNINLEHPWYFRPLGLVTLKIDSAGSSRDEVYLAALTVGDAEALRDHIVAKKRLLDADERVLGDAREEAAVAEQAFFTRSLHDLVIHGLTNNRAWLAVIAIGGLMSEWNVSVGDVLGVVGIDVEQIMRTSSIARIAFLLVLSFVVAGVAVALLSVIVSVIVYHGFTAYRSEASLTIKRGLLTKHEIHVRKSRIQIVIIRQDWLDFLIGRRNVILEQISHRTQTGDDWANVRKKILLPSVRVAETLAVTDEVMQARRIDDLPFTPLSKRYFRKHAAIRSAVCVLALAAPLVAPNLPALYVPLVVLSWALLVALVYLRWKRGGLAVHDGVVVARSGRIGIDYHLFAAFKIQDVRHVQSVLMRRHDVSSLVFRTAASTTRVPYLPTAFAKRVVDYCAYAAESSEKSWM
jgi:putative membrane protein